MHIFLLSPAILYCPPPLSLQHQMRCWFFIVPSYFLLSPLLPLISTEMLIFYCPLLFLLSPPPYNIEWDAYFVLSPAICYCPPSPYNIEWDAYFFIVPCYFLLPPPPLPTSSSRPSAGGPSTGCLRWGNHGGTHAVRTKARANAQ